MVKRIFSQDLGYALVSMKEFASQLWASVHLPSILPPHSWLCYRMYTVEFVGTLETQKIPSAKTVIQREEGTWVLFYCFCTY